MHVMHAVIPVWSQATQEAPQAILNVALKTLDTFWEAPSKQNQKAKGCQVALALVCWSWKETKAFPSALWVSALVPLSKTIIASGVWNSGILPACPGHHCFQEAGIMEAKKGGVKEHGTYRLNVLCNFLDRGLQEGAATLSLKPEWSSKREGCAVTWYRVIDKDDLWNTWILTGGKRTGLEKSFAN